MPTFDRVQPRTMLDAPESPLGEQGLTILAYLCILEGAAAARAGEPATANPYKLSTENGCRWQAGWLEARNAMKESAISGGRGKGGGLELPNP